MRALIDCVIIFEYNWLIPWDILSTLWGGIYNHPKKKDHQVILTEWNNSMHDTPHIRPLINYISIKAPSWNYNQAKIVINLVYGICFVNGLSSM